MIAPNVDAIEVDDLHRAFGASWWDRLRGQTAHARKALDGVSFRLHAGERLAYLGPNGAGKTTMIRCLSGRIRPDRGTVRLMGRNVSDPDARHVIGVVPQEIAVYGDLTTRENLMAIGRLNGVRGRELKQRVDWALHWTGLSDRSESLVGSFSGGMKRRVNLACGVLHDPDVLLLDEPTVGVDPQSRERIFEMLDELNNAGTSILLTTHHLDEAQSRCDRIVIVDHGRVVAAGTFEELVSQTVGHDRNVRLHLTDQIRGSGNEPLVASPVPLRVVPGSHEVAAVVQDVGRQLPRIIDAIAAAGYDVADVELGAPTLHHVFLHLTGHALRDGGGA